MEVWQSCQILVCVGCVVETFEDKRYATAAETSIAFLEEISAAVSMTMTMLLPSMTSIMPPNVKFKCTQQCCEKAAKTDTPHMRRHVSSIGIMITFVPCIPKIDQSCTDNVCTRMHEKEKTPKKKEKTNHQPKNGRKSYVEVLERKCIELFDHFVLTAECKYQKHPKVQEKGHDSSLDQRQEEKTAIFLEEIVCVIDVIHSQMDFFLVREKHSYQQNITQKAKHSYDYGHNPTLLQHEGRRIDSCRYEQKDSESQKGNKGNYVDCIDHIASHKSDEKHYY